MCFSLDSPYFVIDPEIKKPADGKVFSFKALPLTLVFQRNETLLGNAKETHCTYRMYAPFFLFEQKITAFYVVPFFFLSFCLKCDTISDKFNVVLQLADDSTMQLGSCDRARENGIKK